MIDFSKYTLQEQQAINDVLYDLQRYLRDNEMEWQYLHDAFFYSTMELRRAVDEHVNYAEKKLDAVQAEPAGDPPAPPDMFGWVGDALDDLCAAGAPPAEDPAEDPAGLRDLQSLVDDLSRCSARLAALADAEDEHFAECSLVDVYNKVILLRGASRSVSNLVSNIRDHYDGLH